MAEVRRLTVLAMGPALLAVAWGCSGGRPPVDTTTAEATVKGTVKINGKTATKGTIYFDPSNYVRKDAKRASAPIGKDGSFELTTLAGENMVSVQSPEITKKSRLEYNRQSVVLKDGANNVDIDVTPDKNR
jgi:hypothetical protein